jgi:hypothetical protein
MRKNLFFLFILAPAYSMAQDIQVHYDLGKERKYFTTTLEMFRPDSFGSTYWFVDFDYNFDGHPRSMSAAYWEISRDLYMPWFKNNAAVKHLGLHAEYNDGFTAFRDSAENTLAASYNSIFLAGFSYPVKIGKITITAQLLCRMPKGMTGPDAQLTLVWYQPVFHNRVLITGYIDVWTRDRLPEKEHKEIVIQTEPQFWFLILPRLGIGSEIEISKNFPAGPRPWQVNPTVAARWQF